MNTPTIRFHEGTLFLDHWEMRAGIQTTQGPKDFLLDTRISQEKMGEVIFYRTGIKIGELIEKLEKVAY